MINSEVILQCILILFTFTLFYTYKNDFNVFLLTLLLIYKCFMVLYIY